SRRAVVGEVTVAIDVGTGEKIKGMAAVVVEDGRKLEASENAGFFPRAFKHPCDDNLVALIKIRNRPITTQACGIKRRIITVEVRGIVQSFAVGIVRQHQEMIREALLEFENTALIESGRRRTVNVVLENRVRGVGKAEARVGRALGRSPILEGETVCGQSVCAKGRRTAVHDAGGRANRRTRQEV